MTEYIEREALMVALCKEIVGDGDYYNGKDDMQDQIRDMVSRFPSADVAPVRHGRWEYEGPTINTYGMVKCTVCNWWTIDPSVSTVYHYCPNCGAKMDAIK